MYTCTIQSLRVFKCFIVETFLINDCFISQFISCYMLDRYMYEDCTLLKEISNVLLMNYFKEKSVNNYLLNGVFVKIPDV